ncbi:DNA helicase MCM9-like [Neodiprion lecontei]|uniref:DNA helicase MCM9 n=1 Tax=Neodiprion lecontei TaxID=441921 RepID=A0A6J0BU16_NEOLC|nr:DNA helicase MCM9-like [Neodiprion lecontei]
MLEKYFLKHHEDDLMKILEAVNENQHYSIHVNFLSLVETDQQLATKLLHNPREYLPLCDKSAITAQEKLFNPGLTVKQKIHTRITSFPIKVNQSPIGELISTSGIAVRISQPTVLKVCQRYTCRKCKHVTVVELEWERRKFKETKECDACHSRSIFTDPTLQQNDCSDYQEVKIQEKCQIDTRASYASGTRIILLDDLVDKCRPGDHVDICGIVIRQWGSLTPGQRAEASTVIMANSVTVSSKMNEAQFSTNEAKEIFARYWEAHKAQPLVGRDIILGSLCPQIYGMYNVKKALAVVLAGGVSKSQDSGTRIRGEPHLLLIGDPGTSKSQLLRTAARLALRSVLTTGIGSTAAGLTAAAIKDEGGWQLEGGALVLADGGVCCIDEFSSMRSHDQGAIHEAMEQQTISVAKAGLVSTLNSRCTVIAATNPIGGHCIDGKQVLTSLGDALLTRFDLILVLRDNRNVEWDEMIATHILKTAQESSEKKITLGPEKQLNILETGTLWTEETVRDYFALVHTLKPAISPEASEVIRATYRYHRLNPERRAERTTVRLLESLVRLAEGHARLMYRTQVELMDALVAAQLVGTGPMNSTYSSTVTGHRFPADPMADYRKEGIDILDKLNLGHLSVQL